MFRVTWQQGNGYHCSCCRRTWDSDTNFENLEEAFDFATNLIAAREAPLYEDEDDNSDIRIIEFKEISLDLSQEAIKQAIKQAIISRKEQIKSKAEKESQQTLEWLKNKELKELTRLKKKYSKD